MPEQKWTMRVISFEYIALKSLMPTACGFLMLSTPRPSKRDVAEPGRGQRAIVK
jgi:hypothetical protein